MDKKVRVYTMKFIKITKYIKKSYGYYQFGLFECEHCGSIKEFGTSSGKERISCGCVPRKHGMTGTRIHRIWFCMKSRCYSKTHGGYKNYGGRGIKICEEWLESFIKFKDWAFENSYNDTLSIDRIDNDGNYEPGNCRFVTQSENNKNRSSTKLSFKKAEEIRMIYSHTKIFMREIGEMYGVSNCTISAIINNKRWT